MRTGAKPTRPITSLLLAFIVLHVFNAANVRLGVPRTACLSGRNRSAPIVKEHFAMHYTISEVRCQLSVVRCPSSVVATDN